MIALLARLHSKRSQWPWWGQALYFVAVPYVAVAAYGATKPAGHRRPWFVAAGALAGAVAIVGLASDPSEDTGGATVAAVEATSTSAPAATPTTAVPSSTEPKQSDQTTTTEQAPTTAAPEVPGTLGMSPDEFERRWNTAAEQLGAHELRLSVAVDSPADAVQGTFTHFFSDSLSILGSVNKSDGSVRDALLMAQPSSIDDSATTLMAFGVLISTADPEATTDDRRRVLEGVGLLDWDGGEHEGATVLRNVRYTFSSSQVLGIWFTAGDPQDA